MHMTAIHTRTEQKWQDKSARCAEKRRRQRGMLRTFGPIRPTLGAFATPCNAQGGKHLIDRPKPAISPSTVCHLENVG